jgi:hypothetical protein
MSIAEHDRVAAPHPRWVHALHLLFFLIAFGIGQSLLGLIAVVQFVWLLATGGPNQVLRRFGASLARWFADAVLFLTCASNEKPFPWKDWPDSNVSSEGMVI